MIKERSLEFRSRTIEGKEDNTKYCLDWRVYKSILFHILSNAIKHCNSKGKIGLDILYEDCTDEAYIEKNEKNGVKFGVLTTQVLNTGEGMDK